MVCLACLLPLFLIPIVNLIPVLFHILMARVYRLMGWEYRKPERAPVACPYKPPVTNKSNTDVNVAAESSAKDPNFKSVEADNTKTD